jgi:ribosomal protein L31E
MKGNETEYIIPLRKEVMKVAKYDRAKKSVIATREFLLKHTKSKKVLLGKKLNEKLQQGGRKNILPKIHVKVLKDGEKYKAELIGFPIEIDKKEDEKKGSKKEKLKEKITIKKEDEKKETKKEAEKTELKEEKEIKPTKKLPTKEEDEKRRHEKIVSKDEKPKNEKKK